MLPCCTLLRAGLALFAAAWLAACGSGATGIYPFPVFLPRTIELAVPEGTQVSGQPGVFSLSWSHGQEPFSVVWVFNGGTTEMTQSTAGVERLSEASVTFDNPDAEEQTFSGSVNVTDERGNVLREDFSFSVAPAV